MHIRAYIHVRVQRDSFSTTIKDACIHICIIHHMYTNRHKPSCSYLLGVDGVHTPNWDKLSMEDIREDTNRHIPSSSYLLGVDGVHTPNWDKLSIEDIREDSWELNSSLHTPK